ncbi:ribonuclease III [Bacteroidota bacterium]
MLRGILNIVFFLFHKDRDFFFNLVRILGFLPAKISLYRTAFTHKSAALKLSNGNSINNERLEYLGDAVLGAIVAEFLFRKFSDSDEGFLTKLRARIVKRKQLDTTAINMGIPMMITSNAHPANVSKHLYGNALEALIGAIYLDRGFSMAKVFFRKKMVKRHIDLSKLAIKDSDYKSQIIEWAQKNRHDIVFESTEEESKGKIPLFVSHLKLDEKVLGTGRGSSKKEAEQQAAKIALEGISD